MLCKVLQDQAVSTKMYRLGSAWSSGAEQVPSDSIANSSASNLRSAHPTAAPMWHQCTNPNSCLYLWSPQNVRLCRNVQMKCFPNFCKTAGVRLMAVEVPLVMKSSGICWVQSSIRGFRPVRCKANRLVMFEPAMNEMVFGWILQVKNCEPSAHCQ